LVAGDKAVPAAFKSEVAKFMPVGSEDLLKAISHSMNSSLTGQYAVRGSDEHSMKEILALIETAAGKEAGSSKTSNEWMELPAQLMAEFSFG
jgi:hypothetical protein